MTTTGTSKVLWSDLFPGAVCSTLTLESADALLAVIEQARRERPTVLVLTSGSAGWCVGGDLTAFASADDRAGYIDALASKLHEAVLALQALDAIVITVVEGAAAGAGLPLAAAGDIVLASETARFTLGYTKIGLTPDGGTTLLAATLGLHRLLYAALVNPVMDARTAAAHGLVAEVIAPERLHARAEELARSLAGGSGAALAATKRLVRDRVQSDASAALDAEQVVLVAAAGRPDAAEGIDAFLAKRKPSFPRETFQS